MFKYAIVAALFAVSTAQYLRLTPLSLGTSQPNEQQVIILAGGGSAPAARARPLATYVAGGAGGQAGGAGGRAAGAGGASARSAEERPEPFGFQFESEDEFGTKLARQESGDENGKVTGSYSYSDAAGISRTVTYIADDEGFRAEVKTNEPGTLTSNPADAKYESTAQ